MEELFKDHPHFRLKVSNLGVVIGPSGKKLNGKLDNGYRRVGVTLKSDPKVRKDYSVHRLVVETFIGSIPDKMVVNHIDGVKTNNALTNLEIVTQKQNNQHALDNNLRRTPLDEKVWSSVLKEVQVLKIYELIKQGYSNVYISKLYKISEKTIHGLRNGDRWKHLFNEHLKIIYPSPGNIKYQNINECYDILDYILDNPKETNVKIGLKFDLEPSLVSRIKSKNTWKIIWEYYERRATTIENTLMA